MFPAVGRELQMGVAMEAPSRSHFLSEFISEFPVLVPSCRHRRGGVPPSCRLVAVQRADVAGSQPGSLSPLLVVEPAVLCFLLHPGLPPLSPRGTVPGRRSLCFETLDPSLYLMEKRVHEGFLPGPAPGEVESNLFHSASR